MNERLIELTDRMLDKSLSSDESQELQELVESSAQCRQDYYDLCELHALLQDHHQQLNLPDSSDLPKLEEGNGKRLKVLTWLSAVAALFLIAFTVLSIKTQDLDIAQVDLDGPFRGVALASLNSSIGSDFEYGDPEGNQPSVGDSVHQGTYVLKQGIIQLNYQNGAQAIIEAPAKFSLISDKLIACSKGKVSAFVPPEAKNFTVKTPVADIIDLGTEFSVWVQENKFVEAHVFNGSVEAQLPMVPSLSRSLEANDAIRILYVSKENGKMDNISINEVDLRNGFFIRNLREPDSPYKKLISSLNPVIYFPMEMSRDGSTLSDWSVYKNDASANRIAHSDNLLVPGKVGNALHLSGANHRGYLYVPDYPKTEFNQLSVSAWVYAKTRPRWGAIVKNWGTKEWGQFHFGLGQSGKLDIEIMSKDHEKIHTVENLKFPTNSWQHVAFVHDGKQVKLYRNGNLVAVQVVNGIQKGSLKSLGIGTKISDNDRDASRSIPGHWDGSLDEVAIFNTALSEEQIQQLAKAGPED